MVLEQPVMNEFHFALRDSIQQQHYRPQQRLILCCVKPVKCQACQVSSPLCRRCSSVGPSTLIAPHTGTVLGIEALSGPQ